MAIINVGASTVSSGTSYTPPSGLVSRYTPQASPVAAAAPTIYDVGPALQQASISAAYRGAVVDANGTNVLRCVGSVPNWYVGVGATKLSAPVSGGVGIPAPRWFMAAFRRALIDNLGQGVCGFTSDAGDAISIVCGHPTSPTPNGVSVYCKDSAGTNAWFNSTMVIADTTSVHVALVQVDGPRSHLTVDGTTYYFDLSAYRGFGFNYVTLGAGTEVPFWGFTGDIYEVQAGTGVLSGAEYRAEYRRLTGKWPVRYVADGDSITVGFGTTGYTPGQPGPNSYPTLLGTSMASELVGVSNVGTSGFTVSDRLSWFSISGGTHGREQIVPEANTISTICLGTNDIGGQSATAVDTIAKLWKLVAMHKACGSKVILCTLVPRSDLTAAQAVQFAAYNSIIRANWATYADALCDLNQLSLTYVDAVHPDDAGQAVIAAALKPVIQSVIATLTM